MGNSGGLYRALVTAVTALALVGLIGAPASAYTFERTLQAGDEGADVKQLQIRIAGWLERADQRRLRLTGIFDGKTTNAVRAFQAFYGLEVDGIAGSSVFEVLDSLEDDDGSTAHFDYAEFKQNRNSRCSDKANKFAGTFKGGPVPMARVKRNVRRLMWRLEALRAKLGDNPIGINSGFRSVEYNKCIGGASKSQHMYGTSADLRVANTGNRKARNQAKKSQFYGIGCYASFSHNHFDLRLHNEDLPEAQFWWWPERDSQGRDLDESGAPCWGEESTKSASSDEQTRSASLTPRQVEDFESSVEPFFGGLAD